MLPISHTKSRDTLDRLGLLISGACAVHCALTPLVISLLPLLGLLADERAEWAVVAFSTTLGVLSLLPSYARYHRRASPLVIFTSGICLILTGRLLLKTEWWAEVPAVVAGALLIATAHAFNRRLCRVCPACEDRAQAKDIGT